MCGMWYVYVSMVWCTACMYAYVCDVHVCEYVVCAVSLWCLCNCVCGVWHVVCMFDVCAWWICNV